jgi:hypothetical protein
LKRSQLGIDSLVVGVADLPFTPRLYRFAQGAIDIPERGIALAPLGSVLYGVGVDIFAIGAASIGRARGLFFIWIGWRASTNIGRTI